MKEIIIHTESGKKLIQFPTWWGDVSTGQYEEIIRNKVKEAPAVFAHFSGLSEKQVLNIRSVGIEERMLEALSFMQSPIVYNEGEVPVYYDILGKKILLPRKLGALTFGQNLHVRELMDQAETYNELLSAVTAIYLQPLFDGTEFNKKRSDELRVEILKLPITETFNVGFFFLTQLRPLGDSSINSWKLILQKAWRQFMHNAEIIVLRLRGKGSIRLDIYK